MAQDFHKVYSAQANMCSMLALPLQITRNATNSANCPNTVPCRYTLGWPENVAFHLTYSHALIPLGFENY